EVLVKFHAASLNFRDLMFANGVYNPRAKLPAVPLSDGAGEVTELGPGVTRWKTGDRVCPIFMQGWLDGERAPEKDRTALGAALCTTDGPQFCLQAPRTLTCAPILSHTQTRVERMPHDPSTHSPRAGPSGRLVTTQPSPLLPGDAFELVAVDALHLSPLRRGL